MPCSDHLPTAFIGVCGRYSGLQIPSADRRRCYCSLSPNCSLSVQKYSLLVNLVAPYLPCLSLHCLAVPAPPPCCRNRDAVSAAGYYRPGTFRNDSACTELRGSAIAGGCCVNVVCTGLEGTERAPATAAAADENEISATGGSAVGGGRCWRRYHA